MGIPCQQNKGNLANTYYWVDSVDIFHQFGCLTNSHISILEVMTFWGSNGFSGFCDWEDMNEQGPRAQFGPFMCLIRIMSDWFCTSSGKCGAIAGDRPKASLLVAASGSILCWLTLQHQLSRSHCPGFPSHSWIKSLNLYYRYYLQSSSTKNGLLAGEKNLSRIAVVHN